MAWHKIEQDWRWFQPRVRRHWFRLTEEDVATINGKREILMERLDARYGFPPGQAAREIDAWAWLVTASRAA